MRRTFARGRHSLANSGARMSAPDRSRELDAQAAAADQLPNLEIAELRARCQSLDRRRRRAFQERIDLLGEQGLHFTSQAGGGGAGLLQECGALLGRQRDRQVIKRLDFFPAFRLHGPTFPVLRDLTLAFGGLPGEYIANEGEPEAKLQARPDGLWRAHCGIPLLSG